MLQLRTVFLLRCLFVVLFIANATALFAQKFSDLPKYGEFAGTDIALKSCAFDKTADAVVLSDLGYTFYNEQRRMVTKRRIKIKVLNERAVNKANIAIRYHRANDFEFISDIKGIVKTYDEDGNQTDEAKLSHSSITDEWEDKEYSLIRFTMPNVKAGSVFEYSYTTVARSFAELKQWVFQTDIPTTLSRFDLLMIPLAEFSYEEHKLPSLPLSVKKGAQDVEYIFEMKNIAGLRNEPFMDNRKDNLQRLEFRFEGYDRGGGVRKQIKNWGDVTTQFLKSDEFGGQLDKAPEGTEIFIQKTKALPTPMLKLQAAYNYVQKHVKWDSSFAKESVIGIEKAWQNGKGSTADVNFILIAILRALNIEAYPLLVADRTHATVNTRFPSLDQFNHVVTYVLLAGASQVIDAVDTQTPVGVLPANLLNTHAYLVDKKKQELIWLEEKDVAAGNSINVVAELSAGGLLEGRVTVASTGYALQERKAQYKQHGASFVSGLYFDATPKPVISNFIWTDTASSVLHQSASFIQNTSTVDGKHQLKLNLFAGWDNNPLLSNIRFSDANLGRLQKTMVNQTITIPEQYEIEKLPANSGVVTADSSFIITRRTQYETGKLQSQISIVVNKTYIPQEQYPVLQSLFEKIHALLNEPVVVKKK